MTSIRTNNIPSYPLAMLVLGAMWAPLSIYCHSVHNPGLRDGYLTFYWAFLLVLFCRIRC